ncbi:hypothetical protein [uncultured Maricaulis sp.]|uniref:hypothetical protein n=1 Tax=uncultured Maricaulis sp. TaxID=174710 RepID=UPI0030DC46E8|tara:strand:- start:8788 stop:9285 length:498 start_codon:yes stop_codon:yes gene_type:complete
MAGYVGHGRLQDDEWLMRACALMNRDLPSHAPEYTPETELNRSYTTQSAEFETLLAKIDPEGDIDRSIFPTLAFFTASEGWPLDIIFAAIAAFLVWIFMPNWYGIMEYAAYGVIAGFVMVQYLRARRVRERATRDMPLLGLHSGEVNSLTLRMLVKYRTMPVTVH